MSVYDEDIATAKELIQEFGQDCFWQKPALPVADVPGYSVDGVLPDPIHCRMAFFSARDLDRGVEPFLSLMTNTEVPASGIIGLLAGGIEFDPKLTDTLRRGAANAPCLSIEDIDLIGPDGTPILYYVRMAA